MNKLKLILLLIKTINMKNWKTTLTGILTALPTIATYLGIVAIPEPVLQGIGALGIFILGLVSKDHNVTGGTETQPTVSNPPTK